jgi:hypothetical protein
MISVSTEFYWPISHNAENHKILTLFEAGICGQKLSQIPIMYRLVGFYDTPPPHYSVKIIHFI